RRLPGGEACMVRQGYLPWIRQGHTVAAFLADPARYFAEHSTPARYVQSNVDLLRGARLRYPPGELRGVHPDARIAASAELREPVRIGPHAEIGAGAVVGPDAVIGARAIVEPGARVERAVVWAGATARGDVRACIVTPRA